MPWLPVETAMTPLLLSSSLKERSLLTAPLNLNEPVIWKFSNFSFTVLLFDFLNKNKINIKEVDNLFINQGPGKFSGIRTSISVAKALSLTNKLNLYGFNSDHVRDQNYDKIIDLFKKGVLIKNLIKLKYSG